LRSTRLAVDLRSELVPCYLIDSGEVWPPASLGKHFITLAESLLEMSMTVPTLELHSEGDLMRFIVSDII